MCKSVKISYTLDKQVIRAGLQQDVQLTVTLEKANDLRPTLDLILIVDVSASMRDNIDHLKRCLLIFIRLLSNRDRVALITFSGNATVVTSLRNVNNELEAFINNLNITGQTTNLCEGILTGLAQLDSSTRPQPYNASSVILLLTDGHANAGITNTNQIITTVRNTAQHIINSRYCVFTVGFGQDHNTQLLNHLSTSFQGRYIFCRDNTNISTEMDNLFLTIISLIARDVRIRMRSMDNGIRIYHHGITQHTTTLQNNEVEVVINSNLTRNNTFTLNVPLVAAALPENVCSSVKISVQYYDIINQKQGIRPPLLAVINRASNPNIAITESDGKYKASKLALDILQAAIDIFEKTNDEVKALQSVNDAISTIQKLDSDLASYILKCTQYGIKKLYQLQSELISQQGEFYYSKNKKSKTFKDLLLV